ncbi:MAG: hypothetical protein GX245_04980 [Eubacteriaceae bacterium]|nr:hypothetical protein [Eubacteriaceae bacterium]
MEHSLTLSMLYYICGCFYMIFGAYTIVANAKSNVNRLFVITTSSMAIWSFAYAISNSAPTAEASAFWNSFSTFGWGVFYSLFLHFVLILTKTESHLNKRTMFAMIYLPALINIILFAPFGFLAETQYKMVQTDFGWINTVPVDIWGIWFIVYYAVFSIVSILLLFRWWSKFEPRTPLKRQITYFLISMLLPFFLGIAIETLPTLFGNSFFPKLAIIFMMIPVTTLFFALKNFGMLLEKKEETIIFLETEQLQTGDRLRLFQTATAVFVIGAAISFLIGHFSMKGALNHELFLAALLLFIGLLTRLIPLLTKSHTIQNTIFLAICTVGMLFFMITNAETGAITIWSVYILFLLFTVILDSKVHAYIFVVINVIMQIVFGKLYPEVIVTINGSEYLTRIFIIVLSFIAVRYVTSEYTSKMLGYQRFAKGQKVLEKISTNFISMNTENARKKIDEMFEMSAEILDFDHAYLVGFDTDYQEALFLNTYVKDVVTASLPYHPKMKVKTVTLPLVRPLIAQKQPIVCENLIDVPFNEDIEIRDFFMSRGIHSFFALPITANEEIAGMLVVEYFDRSDIANRESRLYFLKIIANILGDAKKKTLYEERLYNVAYFDEITKLANKNMLI